jgi:hypothetical protein
MRRLLMMLLAAGSVAVLGACGGPDTDADIEPVEQVQPAPMPEPMRMPGDTMMHGDTLMHRDTIPPGGQ